MIQIFKDNNPSALFAENRNFDIIKKIYPYANIPQRSLLFEMVENSEFKSVLDGIPTECRSILRINGISAYLVKFNSFCLKRLHCLKRNWFRLLEIFLGNMIHWRRLKVQTFRATLKRLGYFFIVAGQQLIML